MLAEQSTVKHVMHGRARPQLTTSVARLREAHVPDARVAPSDAKRASPRPCAAGEGVPLTRDSAALKAHRTQTTGADC
jgi:hypothetical protein